MKLLRSGIEVDPEKLEELGTGHWVSHYCDQPRGCIGQPRYWEDWHIPDSEVQDTMPNHQE